MVKYRYVPLFLLLLRMSAVDALPYLQGTVTTPGSFTGIDSVRVASQRYSTITYTDPDGHFFLERPEDPLCPCDSPVTDSSFSYSIRVSAHSQKKTFSRKGNAFQAISLYDLTGRKIDYESLNLQSVPFPGRKITPGIVLYRFDRHTTGRILFIDNSSAGTISREKQFERTIIPTPCAVDDTIYLCKSGYENAAVTVTDGIMPETVTMERKQWHAFDIHNHTVLTDGTFPLDSMLQQGFNRFGLDVYANSEHGGSFSTDTGGELLLAQPGQESAPSYGHDYYIARWYTLINFAWPKVLSMRRKYPEHSLLLGLEWNNPGHEHASVGFIDDLDQPDAVADFEYRFDMNDLDTSRGSAIKRNAPYHASSVEALRWLQEKYPKTSYCFINHPSRENEGPNPISMFRDFHNAAPDVFLGLEGMPGHQKYSLRGKYAQPGKQTMGGADPAIAVIGGLWDALLGEGRHLHIIVDSDFHHTGQDFWPGEYAKTWVATTDTGLAAWLKGVKDGDMFAVHGDLINALAFTVDDDLSTAAMGGELHTSKSTYALEIRFRSPPVNNHGDSVRVDHIDLIAGSIGDRIDPSDTVAYNTPSNPSTRLVHRFTKEYWKSENGWNVIRATLHYSAPTYLRLRGTSLAVETPGETDINGNPLPDPMYVNTDAAAWKDLWFYSNPIFIYHD